MEEHSFLFSTLSLLILIIISSLIYLLSKRIKFPYTVLLVFGGILLYPISKIGFLGFLDDFSLNPNILFYVFLPILLFDAAYNIKIKELLKVWKTIFSLSILGSLLSITFIGTSIYYIFNLAGWNVPFSVALLFGSIISATDPVAVVSIFKNMGAPKKLTLIFEGESLFNDGVSVAIFSVIIFVIIGGEQVGLSTWLIGIGSFITMMIGGILFGLIMGVGFSKIIGKINYNEEAEISLSLVSAYLTFVLADIFSHYYNSVPISPIIATVVSSMVIGNYGRYKISPKSEGFMNKFLGFFTFLSNSIVFILMGIIIFSLNLNISKLVIPIILVLVVIMLSRAVSVYFAAKIINHFKFEKKISDDWQKLLFWGGLKGVLALILVLMIPGVGDIGYEQLIAFQTKVGWNSIYGIKESLIILTMAAIFFTTFINAPTISYVMKKMGINKLHDFEKVEFEEWKIIADLKIIKKIGKLYKDSTINKKEYEKLIKKYKKELKTSSEGLNNALEGNTEQIKLFIKRLVLKYALGIEKSYLEKFFYDKRLDEKHYKFILQEIEGKTDQIDLGLIGESSINTIKKSNYWFEKIPFIKEKYSNIDMFIISRTKHEITKKVIKELQKIPQKELGYEDGLISGIISVYEFSSDLFYKKRKELLKSSDDIKKLEEDILNKYFLRQENKLLEDYYNKGIIPAQFYMKMTENINKELYSDLNG